VPTYEYACKSCGHQFDAVQSFSDDNLTECPECSGILRKLYGSVGVVFKGSGFYRNDSRATTSSSSTADSGDATATGSSSNGESSTSAGSQSDSGQSGSGSSGSGSSDGSGAGSGGATATSNAS